MPFLQGLPPRTERDVSLGSLTSLRIGGPVEYLARPDSERVLARVLEFARAAGLSVRVIGGGTNILAPDERVRCVAVKLCGEFADVAFEDDVVHVGAGAILAGVVSESVSRGLAGLETLAGIPGTVGGALAGNSGTHAGWIGDVVETVDVLREGERVRLTRREAAFTYRGSALRDDIILGAALRLRHGDADRLSGRCAEFRSDRLATQPLGQLTAGCFFANPPGHSAGELIERVGLKGARVGDAAVSTRHANFIVNLGRATAADVKALAGRIENVVFNKFGIRLTREVVEW